MSEVLEHVLCTTLKRFDNVYPFSVANYLLTDVGFFCYGAKWC